MKTFLSSEQYIKDLLWIRDKSGSVIPFIPNRVQRRIRQKKREAIARGRKWRFLIPKARRMGVTTKEQADSFALVANLTGQRCVTLAATKDQTRTIFKMATLFYDRLPDELKPVRERANRQALLFTNPASEFFIGTAGATAFARGDTLSKAHGSEVAYWRKGQDQDVVESLIAGITEAASHGEVTLESTSNGNTGWWAETVLEAHRGENEWNVIFLPWWEDPTYRLKANVEEIMDTLTDREQWLTNTVGLDLEQIAWRRAKSSERALRSLFLQEYPERLEESFLAKSSNFFGQDLLDVVQKGVFPPEGKRRCGNMDASVWFPPEEGQKYVIGADVAEGVAGGDFSAAYVLRASDAQVCASLHGRIRPEDFAQSLAELGRWFNGAWIGPERNNHGHVVVRELRAHIAYPRLWWSADRPDRLGGKRTVKFGWDTSVLSRPILLDDLRSGLEDGFSVPCATFSEEAATFEDDGKGKFQARSGCHDDAVMALGISLQVRSRLPADPTLSMI